MEQKIYEIISNQTGIKVKELNPETNLLKDIEINSFDLLTMVSDFEDEFDVEITEKEIRTIRTINDIINLLKLKS